MAGYFYFMEGKIVGSNLAPEEFGQKNGISCRYWEIKYEPSESQNLGDYAELEKIDFHAVSEKDVLGAYILKKGEVLKDIFVYLITSSDKLIQSTLGPKRFAYGPASSSNQFPEIFFEINPKYIEKIDKASTDEWLCLSAHGDFYNLPVDAFEDLFLMEPAGNILRLQKNSCNKEAGNEPIIRKFQRISNKTGRYLSKKGPKDFGKLLTSGISALPKILFAEQSLGSWAKDPESEPKNIPYRNIGWLKKELLEFRASKKNIKLIIRHSETLIYRSCMNFYLADENNIFCYQMPTYDEVARLAPKFHGGIKNRSLI